MPTSKGRSTQAVISIASKANSKKKGGNCGWGALLRVHSSKCNLKAVELLSSRPISNRLMNIARLGKQRGYNLKFNWVHSHTQAASMSRQTGKHPGYMPVLSLLPPLWYVYPVAASRFITNFIYRVYLTPVSVLSDVMRKIESRNVS